MDITEHHRQQQSAQSSSNASASASMLQNHHHHQQQHQHQQQQQQFPATFPETFRNFFSLLNDDEEEHCELFGNILEDKLIPRSRYLEHVSETSPPDFDTHHPPPSSNYHHHPQSAHYSRYGGSSSARVHCAGQMGNTSTATSAVPVAHLGRSSSFRQPRTLSSAKFVRYRADHGPSAAGTATDVSCSPPTTTGGGGRTSAMRASADCVHETESSSTAPAAGSMMLRRRSSVLGFNISDDEKRRKHFAQLAEQQQQQQQQQHHQQKDEQAEAHINLCGADDSDTVSTTSSSAHTPYSCLLPNASAHKSSSMHLPTATGGGGSGSGASNAGGSISPSHHHYPHFQLPSSTSVHANSTLRGSSSTAIGHHLHHQQQQQQQQQSQQLRSSVKRILPPASGVEPSTHHHPHPHHQQQQHQHQPPHFVAAKRSPSLTSVKLMATPSAGACAHHAKGFSVDKINKMCGCKPTDLRGARSPVAARRRAASLIASTTTATNATTVGFAFLLAQQQQQHHHHHQQQQHQADSGGISPTAMAGGGTRQLAVASSASTTELLHSRFKSSAEATTPTTTSATTGAASASSSSSANIRQRQRQRTSSMPVENRKPRLADTRRSAIHCADMDLEYYRLRSFSITSHGICNLGDSMRKRRSRSITSVTSTGTGTGAGSERGRNNSTASQGSTGGGGGDEETANGGEGGDADDDGKVAYKVAMLGDGGVGKTALTYQFTTSDYICAYDLSLDDDYGQKTVSVLLDGQETDLEIIDHPACEMSTESFCSTYNIDHFVVVYSVVDRRTFKVAEQILHYLRDSEMLLTRGAILVGNKTDLERHREVTRQAGRHLAKEVACKFIETSSGLDHNVNELLVGIVAQVKLNPQRIRNLSDKQKMQLAAAASGASNPATMATTVQQKQRQRGCATVAGGGGGGGGSGDDGAGDCGVTTNNVGAVVEAHPLPRTARENQLFMAGGRPFGQRVVLSIKQPHRQRTTTMTTTTTTSSSSALDDCAEAVDFDADNAENTTPPSSCRHEARPGSGGTQRQQPQQSGAATASSAPATPEKTSASPASRISMRTKYLLTSFLKFKRTLRAKRRNSSSCSDLFVI